MAPLVVLVACASGPAPAPPRAKPASAPRSRRFELLLSARVACPTSATYDVWVPLPPREDGQDVERLSAEVVPGEGGFDLDRDVQGNRVLHVKRRGEVGRPIEVKVTLAIETTERHVPVRPIRPLNGTEKKALAPELTGRESTSDAGARLLASDARLRAEAPESLRPRLRLLGTPARRVRGLVLPAWRAPDWTAATEHEWSEAFLGGTGWVPIDPLTGVLGTLSEERIVLARGEPAVRTATRPRVEVDGRDDRDADTRVLVRDR